MFEVIRSEAQGASNQNYQIPQEELRALVERFSRPRHFIHQKAENHRVCEELCERLSGMGYVVSQQGEFRNVVALPKAYSGASLTLVGAHYDSVQTTPGADDNASAVAALLSCAQHLSHRKHRPDVGFVLFNCEEDGLIGSADFVRNIKKLRLQVSRAHILEMLGYTSREPGSQRKPAGLPVEMPTVGDFLGIVGDDRSGVDDIVTRAGSAAPELTVMGLRLPRLMARFLPVLHRSDHASFWAGGVSATFWTDTAEFRNPHYHQPSDTPETLDYHFLQQVTELLIATVS